MGHYNVLSAQAAWILLHLNLISGSFISVNYCLWIQNIFFTCFKQYKNISHTPNPCILWVYWIICPSYDPSVFFFTCHLHFLVSDVVVHFLRLPSILVCLKSTFSILYSIASLIPSNHVFLGLPLFKLACTA